MWQGGFIAPPATTLMGKKPEAQWIWDAGEINPRNTYLHVRRAFHLEDMPVIAVAYVSAHAFAEIFVNGVHVDRVPTNPDPESRYNMRYSAYAFAPNIKLLFDYNILCGAFSQRHSQAGAIRSRYPTGAFLGPKSSTYIPDYQLEWVLMLKEHAMYYG